MPDRLRKLLFDNFIIKVFSLTFAVILWLHVVARGTAEVNFVVPLELRDIPEDLMVVGDVPGYADVRLQGQEGVVRRLSVKDVRAYLSLSGAKPGESAHYLTPANVAVPGNIRITGISPPQIKLRLERVGRKSVPVRPDIIGNPARGYRFLKAEATPGDVTVVGPESSLRKVRAAETEAIDIEGASGSFDKVARLEPPGEYGVKLEENAARISITLTKTRRQARDE